MNFDDWEPIVTLVGTKWVPTVKTPYFGCAGCPVLRECAADVARGDFAWCEKVIPADYTLGKEVDTIDEWESSEMTPAACGDQYSTNEVNDE